MKLPSDLLKKVAIVLVVSSLLCNGDATSNGTTRTFKPTSTESNVPSLKTTTPVPTSPALTTRVTAPPSPPHIVTTRATLQPATATGAVSKPAHIASPATVISALVSTTAEPKVCTNRIDTCSQYGRTPCINPVYEAWAKHNCALFCGFCTPNITSLNPSLCQNKVPNCGEYDDGSLCTAETYYSWAYENCRGYCKFDKCNDTCVDQPGFDCRAVDAALNLCADKQKAKLVCRKYCDLCTLDTFCVDQPGIDCKALDTVYNLCADRQKHGPATGTSVTHVDGKWSSWASWDDCSVTCGNGTRRRTRECNNPPPANGGLFCSGSASQKQPCTRPECPQHGNWNSWSPWGICSVSCDVGMQRRDRACSHPYPARQGDHCFGTPIEYRVCLPGACADGQWSEWEEWSNCSSECGGVRVRERNCSNPEPSALGKQCVGNSEETGSCNCTVPSFTATNLVSGPSSGTVRFSSVLFSEGSDYNATTGVFTCSVPGVYHFTATLTKSNTGSVYHVECYIRLNGSNKIHIYINPKDTSNNGYGYYSASGSVVFRLEENDKVNLGSCSSASHFYSSSSVFTGFLIKSD